MKHLVNKFSSILNEGISHADLSEVLMSRLQYRYPDVVDKYGFDAVEDAVSDVASFHAGAEELGSSDVSIMLKEILKNLEKSQLDELAMPYSEFKDERLWQRVVSSAGHKISKDHDGSIVAIDSFGHHAGGYDPVKKIWYVKGSSINEGDDPCWDNYKQIGMKMKGGKKVPNCVPKEGVAEADKHSFVGKIQRHHELKKKVDQTWKDAADAEQRGDTKGANRAFNKHVRYTNLERPGTWRDVKEQGVNEAGFPHDVDHMPGATIKNPQTACKRCNGHGHVWKSPEGKLLPANDVPGAKRYKCGACKGAGFLPRVEEGQLSNFEIAYKTKDGNSFTVISASNKDEAIAKFKQKYPSARATSIRGTGRSPIKEEGIEEDRHDDFAWRDAVQSGKALPQQAPAKYFLKDRATGKVLGQFNSAPDAVRGSQRFGGTEKCKVEIMREDGTLEECMVNELSNEKLGQYKTAAAADASKADKAGDFKRGDKRFSGIVKATNKQFANDAKSSIMKGLKNVK